MLVKVAPVIYEWSSMPVTLVVEMETRISPKAEYNKAD